MEPRVIVLLVFMAITMLTALAVLAAALGLFPNANSQLISWGIPTVLGEIIVTVIIFFRSQWSSQIVINLTFEEIDPFAIDFDSAKCSYTVIDSSGRIINEGCIAPIMGHGGWQIKLPVSVSAQHCIALTLVSQNGDKWQIRPFLPLVHTQNAVRYG